MYRDHNLRGVNWFLDNVWPQVLAEVPEARLYIVGNKPPDSLCARQDPEHLIITGFVAALAPWYKAAEVFVSPLLIGGGLLQKVMDAMVMGVPVVATSGSNHGIGATPGEHLLVADTPEAFSRAVVHLLRDPAARAELGAAGQRFIRTHYDAEAAFDRWDAALRALI
jgi:glycosyltransferase involved in cell wall biosynthesis